MSHKYIVVTVIETTDKITKKAMRAYVEAILARGHSSPDYANVRVSKARVRTVDLD